MNLLPFLHRHFACATTALACFAGSSFAQPVPSLREALDAAWAQSPTQRSQSQRTAELAARMSAASSWAAGPPSVTLGHRTDRLTGNSGLRELEAEVSVPLWNIKARSATRAQVDADSALLQRQSALLKLKLAGELRELVTQAALAQAEQALATRKLADAGQLAQDVERRLRAGDVARVDALQAQAVVQQATAALAQTQAALSRVQSQWQALTGLATVADLAADSAPPGSTLTVTAEVMHVDHPAIAAAAAHTQAARSRLQLVEADRRDPMEISVGSTVSQGVFGASSETSLRVAVKIPLGGDIRNGARIAAARAELAAAEAEGDAVTRLVNADLTAARADVAAARANEEALQARAKLSAEVQALYAKSYRLGESDLPTRLRTDNERFEADLALGRARVETQRALSRLHQSLGRLP